MQPSCCTCHDALMCECAAAMPTYVHMCSSGLEMPTAVWRRRYQLFLPVLRARWHRPQLCCEILETCMSWRGAATNPIMTTPGAPVTPSAGSGSDPAAVSCGCCTCGGAASRGTMAPGQPGPRCCGHPVLQSCEPAGQCVGWASCASCAADACCECTGTLRHWQRCAVTDPEVAAVPTPQVTDSQFTTTIARCYMLQPMQAPATCPHHTGPWPERLAVVRAVHSPASSPPHHVLLSVASDVDHWPQGCLAAGTSCCCPLVWASSACASLPRSCCRRQLSAAIIFLPRLSLKLDPNTSAVSAAAYNRQKHTLRIFSIPKTNRRTATNKLCDLFLTLVSMPISCSDGASQSSQLTLRALIRFRWSLAHQVGSSPVVLSPAHSWLPDEPAEPHAPPTDVFPLPPCWHTYVLPAQTHFLVECPTSCSCGSCCSCTPDLCQL